MQNTKALDLFVDILLVEDDDIDVENVWRSFAENNILNSLHVAENGYEGLCMLKGIDGYEKLTPTPQILLLDINMPKMTGLDLLKEVRNDKELHQLSAFIMTTSESEQDIYDAYNLNISGYIVKPFKFSSFLEATKTLGLYWSLQKSPEKKN